MAKVTFQFPLTQNRKGLIMNEKKGFKKRSNNDLPRDPLELTDFHLQVLKPREKQYDRLVGGGLVLRVLPSGKIAFRYNYTLEGKQRITTVGSYPRETLKALRLKYLGLSERVEGGENVAETRLKKKASRRKESDLAREKKRNVLRLEGLMDLFIANIENPASINKRGNPYSKKTVTEYRNHLLNHIAPEFGSVPVDELQRKDIKRWLNEKAIKAPSQANHLLSTLGAIFSWAEDEELIDLNLVAGLKKPAGKQKSKERSLDYNPDFQEVVDIGEIKAFWNGLDDINPLHRMALRLMLLTALRPNEVLSSKWEHILADKWVIPVSATKSKKDAHKVPLGSEIKKMLEELNGLTGETPYLFPQSRFDNGKLELMKNGRTGKYSSTETSTVNRHLKKVDIEPFTSHDLRRTAATHIKALGYLDAEIGLLLHHSTADVTSIYARGDDMKRKQKMLNAWHRKLKAILSGKQAGNVVNMR